MNKTVRAMTAMLLTALLIGIMPMAVLAAPQGFDRNDSGDARYTRYDGVVFTYHPGSSIGISNVNWTMASWVDYRTFDDIAQYKGG